MREIRYQTIAEDLRRRVSLGEFAAGRLLPSESELSGSYAASRITIRRALDVLREEGLVDARQGFGWFVAVDPLRQSLGRLGTIEAQLTSSGAHSERRVLDFGFVAAPARARQVLGADNGPRGAPPQPGRRCSRSPASPCGARRTSVPPSPARTSSAPRSTSCSACPWAAPCRRSGRRSASPDDAALLEVPVGSPVLRCERTTSTPEGRPVLLSEHVFPAHRTEFVVDLPLADQSIAPSGLRLLG